MKTIPEHRASLAIEGGPPVRGTMLPYGHQTITEDDLHAVMAALQAAWLTTGPTVGQFEERFAATVGARHAVAFSSGTAALHGAVFAAGIGPGDEVITTPLTFCATANAVLYQGGTPVFADVRHDTLNLNVAQLERHLTPRTRALLPVDFAGHPAELDELLTLADKQHLIVIEDAAHALGGRYRQRPVGSISHLTTFSFHPVKHVTTTEGGMVTTNSDALARALRMFRNHGIDSDAHTRVEHNEWRYEMTALGYNYRLSDVASALGLSQLSRLPANVARRRQIADAYRRAFRGLTGITLVSEHADVESAWHLFPIRIDPAAASRDQVFRALRAEGIGVNVHYIPVHHHPYYEKRFGVRRGLCPVAEQAAAQLLSVPMFHGMTDDDVDDVIEAVGKVMTVLSAR